MKKILFILILFLGFLLNRKALATLVSIVNNTQDTIYFNAFEVASLKFNNDKFECTTNYEVNPVRSTNKGMLENCVFTSYVSDCYRVDRDCMHTISLEDGKIYSIGIVFQERNCENIVKFITTYVLLIKHNDNLALENSLDYFKKNHKHSIFNNSKILPLKSTGTISLDAIDENNCISGMHDWIIGNIKFRVIEKAANS